MHILTKQVKQKLHISQLDRSHVATIKIDWDSRKLRKYEKIRMFVKSITWRCVFLWNMYDDFVTEVDLKHGYIL